MWVAPETRCPVLLHHPTRKSVDYFGAVRLRDGKFLFRRETERFNAVTCWQFLKELRARSAHAGRKVVVIVDNAKYHHARLHRDWRQAQADNFVLDFLPPYSPDLNPIERVWKLARRLAVHNRYFPHLDDVVLAVETQFAQWKTCNEYYANYAQLLKTLSIIQYFAYPFLLSSFAVGASGAVSAVRWEGGWREGCFSGPIVKAVICLAPV